VRENRHEALTESGVASKRGEEHALWVDVHAGVDRRYGVTVIAIPEQARLGKQVARSRRVRSDERIVDRMALINRIRPSSTSKMAVA
jgi:hypothetical protein